MKAIYRDRIALLSQTARLVDFGTILIGAYLAAYWARPELLSNTDWQMLVLLVSLESFIIFPMFNVYRSWRGREMITMLARSILAWICVLSIASVILIIMTIAQSWRKELIYYWGPITAGLLIAVRVTFYLGLREIRRRGWNQKQVIIIGAGELGQDLLKRIQSAPWTGYTAAALYDDDPELIGSKINRIDVSNDFSGLVARITKEHIHEVWIALPLKSEERVREIQYELRHSTVDILYVPDIMSFTLINHSVSEVVGVPVIELTASPMAGVSKLIKWLEDYLLASLILILISPVMLVIACAITLESPGPVFYKQKRVGWNGKIFTMYKLRSMTKDSESTEIMWGNAANKKVTRIGTFIRKVSMDELPQFFNVLKGDMSIVGPRPERPAFVEEFKDTVPGYMKKHLVKAGITGWAQIHGWRGDTDISKRIEYDLMYINNWSLWLDIRIILQTMFSGFIGK